MGWKLLFKDDGTPDYHLRLNDGSLVTPEELRAIADDLHSLSSFSLSFLNDLVRALGRLLTIFPGIQRRVEFETVERAIKHFRDSQKSIRDRAEELKRRIP